MAIRPINLLMSLNNQIYMVTDKQAVNEKDASPIEIANRGIKPSTSVRREGNGVPNTNEVSIVNVRKGSHNDNTANMDTRHVGRRCERMWEWVQNVSILPYKYSGVCNLDSLF